MGGELFRINFVGRPESPDYLIILPGGHIGFAVFPASLPDKELVKTVHMLRRLGCAAGAITEKRHVTSMINYTLSDAGRSPGWRAYREFIDFHKKRETEGGDAL